MLIEICLIWMHFGACWVIININQFRSFLANNKPYPFSALLEEVHQEKWVSTIKVKNH